MLVIIRFRTLGGIFEIRDYKKTINTSFNISYLFLKKIRN